MTKRKSQKRIPIANIRIYGILSLKNNKFVFVSLDLKEVNCEFDLSDDYTEKTHCIVYMDAMYDFSNLE